jgi:hypothetical protein
MTHKTEILTETLYHQDYYLWLKQTIEDLKHQNLERLDWNHLLEEIEALGKREQKAIKSNLRIVILHLLKWNYQRDKRSQSWIYSIAEHRQRLYDDFESSPALKRYCEEIFIKVYQEARKLAVKETGLPLTQFPATCPFLLEQVLEEDWLNN